MPDDSGDPAEGAKSETELEVLTRKVNRFSFTDDGLAWVILLSFVYYIWLDGSGTFDLGGITPAALGVYLTIIGIATTWVFGKQAVKTWRSGK